MKVLVVSFPGGRSDETWKVGDQASLASLLRGGSLAPAATPSERLTSLKVLDSGAYSFVPPEAAQDVAVLHNVTLAFDLMGEGTSEPLTYRSLSASHLDEKLRQVEALGLAETEEDARALLFNAVLSRLEEAPQSDDNNGADAAAWADRARLARGGNQHVKAAACFLAAAQASIAAARWQCRRI